MSYVRVIPELRAAHIERHLTWGRKETILYYALKYDVSSTSTLPPSVEKFSVTALLRMTRSSRTVIEIPEPLWVREALRTLLWALPLKTLRRGRVSFVTYCIENNEFAQLVGTAGRNRFVQSGASVVLGTAFRVLLSKVAYGSPASERAYRALRGFARVPHRQFLELPAKPVEVIEDGLPQGALFFGRLEERKGLRELTQAWEAVERSGEHVLTIIGDGPLSGEIDEWVERRPRSRRRLPHVEHERLPSIIRQHSILVAPSKPSGRWREQIGLPIKESLAHGLTVVTTSETGLSEWLSANGHLVVEPGRAEPLATAIVSALGEPLGADRVIGSLPERDGRERADAWLASS